MAKFRQTKSLDNGKIDQIIQQQSVRVCEKCP